MPIEIRRFRHDGRFDSPIHAHDRGQLFALDQGLALIRSGVGDWIMPSGRLCWMPAGVPHGVLTLGPVAGTSLYVDAAGLPPRPAVLRAPPLALSLLARIVEVEDPGRGERLLAVLLDELGAAPEEPLRLPTPRDPRLRRMTAALAADPADRRRLDDWAAALGLPKRTLVRRFKAETGLGFVQWRHHARLIRAAALLGDGASVTEAALTVGYDSVSAFITRFRAGFGVTPGRFGTDRD
ncbi:AraC family transcriptional regulator [Mycobacterium sp. KBS0706]|uniref:helix-turn-helix transcriptional regulator n=1 Tax=Mycobacterium sp. KBS0706 TaxID=2578109 RepID=UPI00110F7DFA|nr:helix-turn-helix transcriptional regulator [Mycobacterium sp. KBS0706]TSD89773.1 AraC family transcriptional regulator [Mycobacterium sp. KBS0706]